MLLGVNTVPRVTDEEKGDSDEHCQGDGEQEQKDGGDWTQIIVLIFKLLGLRS